ncbi:MAG: outer membrane protein assembly factor BamA [Alphaproteobacteria bacterium]|nr:outer membrane protein assembly factor BamA [Alphaproteobacteria bacterium]
MVVGLAAGAARAQSADGFIREIRIEGNNRIEADTILTKMLLAAGDRYDPARADRSLKALVDTGLFADVVIRRQGDIMVVTVVENPVINRIAFEGNKRIDDNALDQEVTLRPREVYTRSRIQSDARRIQQVYRRSGRFAATVEPKVIQLEQNRVDVVFEINEGPLTGIRKIEFIGNRAFSDGSLRDAIVTKESAWYRFLTSDDTYDPDRMTLDRDELRRFYRSRGYADFRVVSAVAELTADRDAFFITFSVEEGERYNFGVVDITTTLKNLEPESLRSELTTFEGETFDASAIEDSRIALTFALGRLGYAFVDVRPRISRDREEKLIGVTYEIKEGPRVYVERINITGNVRTLDKVIRREFRIAEGDAFNTAKLRRSRQRVRGLGFFDRVEMTQEPGTRPDRVVVNMDVQERSTGELSFGAGVSSSEALIGDITLRERNLLGRGQDLKLRLRASFKRQLIDLSFTEPYFLDRDLAAGFDVYRMQINLQSRSSFDQQLTGGRLRTSYAITERLRQSVHYTIEEDVINDIDSGASVFIRAERGDRVTSAVGTTFTYSTLDDRFLPTTGYRLSGGPELGGLGGDVRYLQNTGRAVYYHPFTEELVGSLGFNAGYITGLSDDVGIRNRFFIGGETFRGFESGGIGPRDSATSDSLGGNAYYVGTAELRFPLAFIREFGVLGRVFTEAGSLWSIDVDGPTLLDSSFPRMSAGAGLSWRSPFGPIRIDLAHPIVKEDYDERELFRFSFGTRF